MPNRFAPGEYFKSNALFNKKVALWYGDITRLEIDAIVNTTSSMLMCQPIGGKSPCTFKITQVKISKTFQCIFVNIFLPVNFNIYFGCSKEQSH